MDVASEEKALLVKVDNVLAFCRCQHRSASSSVPVTHCMRIWIQFSVLKSQVWWQSEVDTHNTHTRTHTPTHTHMQACTYACTHACTATTTTIDA